MNAYIMCFYIQMKNKTFVISLKHIASLMENVRRIRKKLDLKIVTKSCRTKVTDKFVLYIFTTEIAMVSSPPLQVRVVPSVELHRPLDRVPGDGVRRRRRSPRPGRTGLGDGGRHGGHPREVTVVVVMLLVVVIVVVIVHVQIGRRVQPRAGHGLVLGAVGLGRFHFDVGHLERLVVEHGEHILRVHHLVHFEPRRLLRLVRMVAGQARVLHEPGPGHTGRVEQVAHDRLVSGLDRVLVLHHQPLQHRVEVRRLKTNRTSVLNNNTEQVRPRRCSRSPFWTERYGWHFDDDGTSSVPTMRVNISTNLNLFWSSGGQK